MARESISRRQFLVGTGIGIVTLGGAGILASRSPVITFAESTLTQGKSKALVAYCSQYGSTSEVAMAIGKALHQEGFSVDVRKISTITDISGYQAAVIGSPLQSGKWMPEAITFLEKNRSVFATLPIAYFLTCMTVGLTKDPKARDKVAEAFSAIYKKIPEVKPVETAIFAGALDYSKMSTLMQLMYRAFAEDSRSGDYRDWNSITAWAKQAVVKLS